MEDINKENQNFSYNLSYNVDKLFVLQVSIVFTPSLGFSIIFEANYPKQLLLHWGIAKKHISEWQAAEKSICPENTTPCPDKKAVQTLFNFDEKTNKLEIFFPEKYEIKAINFVLTYSDKKKWHNNSGRNYCLVLKKQIENDADFNEKEIVAQIIHKETSDISWTLMHRFNLARENLNKNNENLAWIYVWLRYSFLRQLTWQRKYNTPPKELTHAQNQLAMELVRIYIESQHEKEKTPSKKHLIQMILTTIGKGSANGQLIRDEILKIMHKNHIKETNDHFYEQWHQKLHNNTTPDDIGICEALIAFLENNGNLEFYWKTLKQHGITAERLRSFERPIRVEPHFLDYVVHDFKGYLKLLKTVHSAEDLETAFECASNTLCQFSQNFNDILNNKNSNDITQLKRAIDLLISLYSLVLNDKNINVVKEGLFVILALESYIKNFLEKTLHISEFLIEKTTTLLSGLQSIYQDDEITCICADLEILLNSPLKTKALIERLQRFIGDIVERMINLLQKKAETLGTAFKADKYIVEQFTEEVLRGGVLVCLSALLKKINKKIREEGKLPPWEIISPGKGICNGKLIKCKELSSIQFKVFSEETILVCPKISGTEELPEGVTGVLLLDKEEFVDAPDVLSHFSVRTRNCSVLFLACFDSNISEKIEKFENQIVEITIQGEDVAIVNSVKKTNEKSREVIKKRIIEKPKEIKGNSFIEKAENVKENCFGKKTKNLLEIQKKIGKIVNTPKCLVVPFYAFEQILEKNRDVEERIKKQIDKLDVNCSEALNNIKKEIVGLKITKEIEDSFLEKLKKEFNLDKIDVKKCFETLCRVWASKFNERVFLATKKNGISIDDIVMSVLVQEVIPADFAFVVHTKNPKNNNEKEIFCEMVSGLGETLVGAYPGRSFSFTCKKSDKKPYDYEINSYPSKSVQLKGSGIIFRSDSNCEDLEDFAGAGIFDSFLVNSMIEEHIMYSKSKIITDENYQKKIIETIIEKSIEIEKSFGTFQDIEGVVSKDEVFVVQTRPQV